MDHRKDLEKKRPRWLAAIVGLLVIPSSLAGCSRSVTWKTGTDELVFGGLLDVVNDDVFGGDLDPLNLEPESGEVPMRERKRIVE